jgi:tetratricopeptide (TPR) repeat protein
LEGSVVKSKDSVRVALRLVSAEDGRVLWSGDSAEHSLGDVLAFQDELARSVTYGLRPKLGGTGAGRIAKGYTANQEANQLYLKGRYFWNKRTGPDLDRAIDYFQRAINLDPGYALAYSGLADSYAVLSYFSDHPFEETLPKARAAAEKALEIDNGLAEPHATLGFVNLSIDWDWARAESEYRRALELNANYATAHQWYGWYLINVGRQDESVREMERALELDPFSIEINVDLGAVLAYAHRPDEAIKRFQMALEMDQNFVEAHWGLGLAYQRKGEHERAIIELEKARDLSEGRRPDILAELGRSYALTGNKSKALAVITRLKALPKETNISSYHLAKVYLGLGEKDKALTALEAALQARSSQVIGLKCEPAFDELRGEPRFQKILAAVGLA